MEARPMLNRSKIFAVALLAAVFLAGGAAGWLLREGTDHDGRPRGGGAAPTPWSPTSAAS